jgi:putrescine---pyruvate transaminase
MEHRLWHPFSNMAAVSGNEFVIDRAEDVWVWDAEGRRYLDGTASLWYCNAGHGRQEIIDRVTAQLARLDAYQTFGDFSNGPAMELADRLAALAPVDDAKVFLASGGGDAIDTAAKLARRHWVLRGRPNKLHLLSRTGGYHGTHGFGTSLGGIEPNVSGWGPLVPATSVVPYDSLEALEAEILRVGPEHVAAFFCEPVIGAGGVLLPPEGYLEGVADLCAEHEVLLVIDSVICGFGRLGTWFGIERWGVRPDLITFAKGVTSGYLPLGGVVVSGAVAEPFWGGEGALFRHGATYGGHPTCCAAALANLDVLERDGLVERGRALEGDLADVLAPLADLPQVSEVRSGIGLIAAVGIDPELIAADPTAPYAVAGAARRAGVIVRPLGAGVAVSPPLTVEREHLELIGSALQEAVAAAGATAA